MGQPGNSGVQVAAWACVGHRLQGGGQASPRRRAVKLACAHSTEAVEETTEAE